MIRVHILRSKISREQAAALNQESGRIYTGVMVEHWRIYKKGRGHWLSGGAAERYNDYLGGPTSLHAHSRDAAQQGFYKACKVVNTQRKMGLNIRYPWRRKFYRTTIWKNTGISLKSNMLRLALARGHRDAVRTRLGEPIIMTQCIHPVTQSRMNWVAQSRADCIVMTNELGRDTCRVSRCCTVPNALRRYRTRQARQYAVTGCSSYRAIWQGSRTRISKKSGWSTTRAAAVTTGMSSLKMVASPENQLGTASPGSTWARYIRPPSQTGRTAWSFPAAKCEQQSSTRTNGWQL